MGVLFAFLAGTVGCDDAGTDPMAVLVAAETHGALALSERLPTLPDLVERSPVRGELIGAADLWALSWRRGEDGRQDRGEAYASVVPRLSTELGSTGIADALDAVRSTLDAADSMDPTELPGFVIEGTRAARELAEDAEQSLARGERERALLRTLEASDRLHELGPEEVAQELIRRAEEALGRKEDAVSYSELEVERSRHLLIAAREAMDRGDHLRAIRRAFYACQLLGVELL